MATGADFITDAVFEPYCSVIKAAVIGDRLEFTLYAALGQIGKYAVTVRRIGYAVVSRKVGQSQGENSVKGRRWGEVPQVLGLLERGDSRFSFVHSGRNACMCHV